MHTVQEKLRKMDFIRETKTREVISILTEFIFLQHITQYAITANKGVRVGKKEKKPIYTIFQIDTTKIPNVTFYKDFDFDTNSTEGIFTYSYITPEAISKEQTIDLEQMLSK